MSTLRLDHVARLYSALPGAPMPPTEDGWYLWGEVEGNDHWVFCETLVDMMMGIAAMREKGNPA
jgi:hypothetical protein